MPPIFFYDNPLLCSFSLQLIFFSEQPFCGNDLTLDSHTNTVISHTFAYLSRLDSHTYIHTYIHTYFIDFPKGLFKDNT